MQRTYLKYLNTVFFALLLLIAVSFQSTLFSYHPIEYFKPDLILLIVVYFGFRRTIIEGGIFAIIAGLILKNHSSAASHFAMTVYLYLFLISKILSRAVASPNFLSSMSMVAFLTLLKKTGFLILTWFEGSQPLRVLFDNFLIYLIPGVLAQALLTPLFFGIFKELDHYTHKDELAEIGENDFETT